MPDLISPCQPVPPVSQGFNPPGHNGVDLAVPIGTAVLSPAAGVISWWHDTDDNAAGIHINIDHDNGYQTREFHLKQLLCVLGERVAQGQLVALSGNTGQSTGPHLHYEVRLPHNNPIDPAPYLLPYAGATTEAHTMKIINYKKLGQILQFGVNSLGQLLQSSYAPKGGILLQDKVLLTGLVPGVVDVTVDDDGTIRVAVQVTAGNNAYIYYVPGKGWFNAFDQPIN